MKLIIDRKVLLTALQEAAKATTKKALIQVLECFLIKVENGYVYVTGSDGETTLTTRIEAVESEDGVIAVGAERLLSAIKEISDQPITLESTETDLKVKWLNGSCSMPLDNAEVYPIPTTGEITAEGKVDTPTGDFIPFLSDDAIRPILGGVLVDIVPGKVTLAATDGHSLACRSIGSETEITYSFVLPKKVVNILRDCESWTFKTDGEKAIVTYEETSVTCRLLEGKYPNYRSVIPNNENLVVIDRQSLISALKRVGALAPVSNLVKFVLDYDGMTISSEDLDFGLKAEEKVACHYNGEKLAIGFNGEHVIAALRSISGDEVEIRLRNPQTAAVIYPSGNADDFRLQMPILLNDAN